MPFPYKKNMYETECFEDIINHSHISYLSNNENDLLNPSPIKTTIERDSKLELTITQYFNNSKNLLVSDHNLKSKTGLKKSIEFTCISNNEHIAIKANGILLQKVICDDEVTEVIKLDDIEGNSKNYKEKAYLIEWLENLKDNYYILPDFYTKSEKRTIFHNKNNDPLIIDKETTDKENIKSDSSKEYLGYYSYLYLNIHDQRLCLVPRTLPTKKDNHTNFEAFGYILYEGCPSEEIRRKIRDCLSFFLGRYLVYLGYSTFSKNWKLTSFRAITAYNIIDSIYRLPYLPPAPLHERADNVIDSELVSNLINSLYSQYDLYNFRHILWRYWHAICSPLHMAALQYGATIEYITNSYAKKFKQKLSGNMLEKCEWNIIKSSLTKIINETNIEENSKERLKEGISQLNDIPIKSLIINFCKVLNIKIGETEKSAWKARNKAAHGLVINDNEYKILIDSSKILKILLHRIILALIGINGLYYDYFSTSTNPFFRKPLNEELPHKNLTLEDIT